MTPNLFVLVREWALENNWYVSGDTSNYFLNIGPSDKHQYLSIYEDGKVCCSDIENGKPVGDRIRYVYLSPCDRQFFDRLKSLVIAEPLDVHKNYHS